MKTRDFLVDKVIAKEIILSNIMFYGTGTEKGHDLMMSAIDDIAEEYATRESCQKKLGSEYLLKEAEALANAFIDHQYERFVAENEGKKDYKKYNLSGLSRNKKAS